ncbi:GNAT family protein [Paenibacillus sediminis]|uniref:Ribosomal-protein-serine acetyltransferase n=1 Tax=Paenibacillus sediminis TaxID=664909 RepID=A0ABS4H2P7_9BACL|nr:GNAT family protein [Paenibacillus sediminis]MBP1936741.1 ribosomal-protein-serine acetyltransferase [Paenibacillus sediminis]
MFTYALDEETLLKLLAPEHVAPLFKLTNESRKTLRKWLPWVDAVTDIKHTESFVKGAMNQTAQNGGFTAGIWYRGDLAGIIGLHQIDWRNRTVSIGYWLGHRFEGKGLMTSACRALVDHALVDMNLNRVEIRCATHNEKSRAIPERLHFILEGVIREAEKLPDGYVDHVVYGMLQREWNLIR